MIQIRVLEDMFGAAASAHFRAIGRRNLEAAIERLAMGNRPEKRPPVVILETRDEVKAFLGLTGEGEPPELATCGRLCSGLTTFERDGVTAPGDGGECFGVRTAAGRAVPVGVPGALHFFHKNLASPAEKRLLAEETD